MPLAHEPRSSGHDELRFVGGSTAGDAAATEWAAYDVDDGSTDSGDCARGSEGVALDGGARGVVSRGAGLGTLDAANGKRRRRLWRDRNQGVTVLPLSSSSAVALPSAMELRGLDLVVTSMDRLALEWSRAKPKCALDVCGHSVASFDCSYTCAYCIELNEVCVCSAFDPISFCNISCTQVSEGY